MAGNTQIDISQLPAPVVVEQLSFDAIKARNLAYFLDAVGPDFDAPLESDPVMKLIEKQAWVEVNLRKRANDSAVAVMLAFARDSDLDHIGATYGVPRNIVTPADNTTTPPTAEVKELDADYKARIQLSFEGYTTAGSDGSYEFHARSADGDVKDVSTASDNPGEANIFVLSRTGDGTANAALIAKVEAALSAETVRPFTDHVIVASAAIIPYTVSAELTFYDGPDAEVVRKAAEDAVRAYVDSVHRIGYDVATSGLMAALHQPGVQSVHLIAPLSNIVVSDRQASFCTGVSVTKAGTGE